MADGPFRKGRAAFALSLLILLIFSAFILYDGSTEEAEAVLPISAQFSFANEQENRVGNLIEIQTGPGQTGMVIVDGTLEFYRSARLLRTRIFIDLHFSSDNIAVVGSVFPQIIDIQPQAKLSHYPIKVNIQVSPMTKYSTGVNPLVNVTVWGEWRAKYQDNDIGPFASGNIPEYPLYVNVRPYHYLQMTFDPVMLELSPGSSGWVTCMVKNNGNGYERVELSIPGELAYAKSGWIFEFESTVIDIGPNEEGYARIKITAPRKLEPKYHMEMYDFSIMATSYYANYRIKDGDLYAPVEYETGIFIQVNGIDFLYVPWMWTITIWSVMALILFNIGINPFTMRRRKVLEPGFVVVYHLVSNPERRARMKERREQRRKDRLAAKLEREEEKKRLGSLEKKSDDRSPPKKERPLLSDTPRDKKKAPVLDLRRTDDDFDIAIPIEEATLKPKREKRAPLLGGGRKPREVEKDMIDVLGSLDD